MAVAFELRQSPPNSSPRLRPSGARRHPAPVTPPSGRHLRAVPSPKTDAQAVLTLRRATAIVAAGVVGFVAITSLSRAIGGALIDGAPAAPAAHVADQPVVVRLVRPGDTLWAIAGEYTTGDVRPVVDALARVNGGRVDLVVGQEILVPADLREVDAA